MFQFLVPSLVGDIYDMLPDVISHPFCFGWCVGHLTVLLQTLQGHYFHTAGSD
jgi:hypothetical protein